MSDCIFCKIIAGEIPAKKVYEDDWCLAFEDLDPKAPVHLLVIPKEHIAGMDDISGENSGVAAHIFEVIPGIMKSQGVTGGYRVITNCGDDAGQSVHHLHFHCLGGKPMGWTPA